MLDNFVTEMTVSKNWCSGHRDGLTIRISQAQPLEADLVRRGWR